MNVLFLSPAYPPEMRQFTRGLAEVGATVWGVGDQPTEHLSDYLSVPHILDEEDVHGRVMAWLRGRRVDRVESNWEPTTLLAARLRETLGIPGMSRATVERFRDKPLMRAGVEAAGLRIPRTARVSSRDEVWAASRHIGFPLILKPVAGAGSADTHRVDGPEELDGVLDRVGHHAEMSCEEYIEGDELTYETLCIDGRPVYESVSYYIPNVLVARRNEWMSPIIMTVRDMTHPAIQGGIALGRKVLGALGMGTGFTHMEWFRKPDGEAVFGEIACRPPGACMVDLMNYTSDVDLFREWARVVCWKSFDVDATRKYNSAIVFKRAQGEGRIRGVTGLEAFRHRNGRWIAREDLLPVGAPRRDWQQTFLADGHLVVRHPDHGEARRLADEAASTIAMYAG